MAVGKDTWVLQINRMNKMLIKEDINILGVFFILLDFCEITFVSLNEASHHNNYDQSYKEFKICNKNFKKFTSI